MKKRYHAVEFGWLVWLAWSRPQACMTCTAQDMVHQKGFDLVMMARISCTYVRACMRTCSNFDFAQKDLPLSLSTVCSIMRCMYTGRHVRAPAGMYTGRTGFRARRDLSRRNGNRGQAMNFVVLPRGEFILHVQVQTGSAKPT